MDAIYHHAAMSGHTCEAGVVRWEMHVQGKVQGRVVQDKLGKMLMYCGGEKPVIGGISCYFVKLQKYLHFLSLVLKYLLPSIYKL